MNITPHISGAATAHKAAPVPASTGNSSLADFLLAGSAGDAGQDFRAIAATLFGVADSSTPAKTEAPVKGHVAAGERDADKRKTTSASSESTAHLEMTVSVLNVPQPPVQVASSQSVAGEKGEPSPPILELTGAQSKLSAEAATREIKGNVAAKPVEGDAPSDGLPENWTAPPIAGVKQQEVDSAAAMGAQGSKESSPASSDNHLFDLSTQVAAKGKQPASVATDPNFLAKKSSEPTKSSSARPQEAGDNGTPKHVVAQASNVIKPAAPEVTNAAADPNSVRSAVPEAASLPAVAQPTSAASELLKSPAAVTAPQASSATAGLAAESRVASSRATASEAAKIKERGKDRANNELRITPGLTGKSGSAQTGQVSSVPANSGSSSNKDAAGMALPNHSGAHARQVSPKPSAGAPSSAAAITDTDGPDEALPANGSLPVTAKLVQGMSQSEFRVGMQSQEFGNIDIRTSVARHMFSAQISVEHSDVAKSLVTELPSLYSKLADQHVPVANILIQGQGAGTSSGHSQDAQPQNWRPQSGSYSAARSSVETVLPVMTEGLQSSGRLDIRI